MSITINVTDEAGDNRDISWEDYQTLLEAVQAAGFPVLATCGGNASCATCHAFIDPAHYEASGERTEAESDLLDMVDDVANDHSRLCCQVEFAPGMDGAEIQLQAAM
ncbi:MAG: 2Fe-2S iron-sulfur cluster-binding protein [Rothia sp. (in: high G+C Gram-positive bacteria)]|uniref:2Fe-2S iron-sulfur cluster-binding protein n=1 Tax=Rothia sp. (in: high G+C Gram-positive bacteria) TaxID=1885016 RepID=UPI0026E10561|nr:2Fe-2S iron-sulfur cluster-binding protein [Rothia sp. (in: high G+C Gram-positive bacteria)]MDO5750568.1 2Fe-2S iron-sulfur cluster-binding protein [Rothia sp. (in: high G+C Gram-positive bacteria)]